MVAGVLDDLAAIQTSIYPRRAYERAARAVTMLERQLSEACDEQLTAAPQIGQSASRVIRELVTTGQSQTMVEAVARSGRPAEVQRRRELRDGFMSLAAARMVLADDDNSAVGLADYRGDFQMHSTWSDGARSIPEMVVGCVERGYSHLTITDHSAGLSIASGMSSAAMAEQHAEIDAVNETARQAAGASIRVFKGIEANILGDGAIDVGPADLPTMEMVLAAPHSKLDSREDQTARLVRAVESSAVDVLAHPSGRKFGRRAGLRVHWGTVFAAAIRHEVAIELDGDPSRQDLSLPLVARALDAGCLFAIDSDAHDVDQLAYVEIALAHARLAGVPASRVVNCWSVDEIEAWLLRRRGKR